MVFPDDWRRGAANRLKSEWSACRNSRGRSSSGPEREALSTAAKRPGEEHVSGFVQLRICAPIDAASKAQLKQRSKLVESNDRTDRDELQVKNDCLRLK